MTGKGGLTGIFILCVAVILTACGGGGTPPAPVVTTHTVGGTVSGLTGAGLVLHNNGGDNLTVPANASSFTFATAIAAGGAYSVSVLTQPDSQACAVTNGSGMANANISNVVVNCTATTHTVGGTVSGLTGAGLVLHNNGGDNLAVPANASSFTFATAIAAGGAYSVSVLTQPDSQACAVTNGSGTANANISNVVVNCVAKAWQGAALIETDNAGSASGPQIAIDANGNALAVWRQYDGTRYNIWVNRYTAGSGWGVAALIETDNAGDALDPQIAIDANGNALAVWVQHDGTRENIWANRYTAGSGWGMAALIETDNTGDATEPQIAIDANGKIGRAHV